MQWISSIEQEPWQTRTAFSSTPGEVLTVTHMSPKTIYGFGSCLSEICVKPILELPRSSREALFDELFSEQGCNFNFCRLPIGANDLAESWYSYNETDGDYTMEHFSVERDEKYILPAVREAMKRCKTIRFFASPWSPPTWMKFPKVYNYGQLVMTPENLKAYALYFRKYLLAYREKGVNITQLHVQNEIFADQKFPSCTWTGEQLKTFLSDYLIDAVGDLCEVWFGTVNGPEDFAGHTLTTRHNQFLNLVMQDPKCRRHIKGAAYQWAGKFGILQAEEDYPHLDCINSECECGDGNNTWDHALYTYEMMHHYFKHGASACVYWNVALDVRSTTSWGWRQNSLITVRDDSYTFNPEFYIMKHFSHFVKPGAKLLYTKGAFSSNTTLFQNPDGQKIAVIVNPFTDEKSISLENQTFILQPRSINTIAFE